MVPYLLLERECPLHAIRLVEIEGHNNGLHCALYQVYIVLASCISEEKGELDDRSVNRNPS